MPSSAANLLIVEDDKEWCAAYLRAAAREGIRTVKVAKSLAEAEAFINDLQFAVAFIDVGLNVSDDQNVDGVRVMDKIRKSGDETSIVVVTGRRGRDVIPITRDAIRKYDAYEILQKADIEPKDIRTLLTGGIVEFRRKMSATQPAAHEALAGTVPSWKWDDQMLRVTGAKDGIRSLYTFLDGLLTEFLPLVPPGADAEGFSVDIMAGVARGDFWSRSAGQAIVICFGAQGSVEGQIDAAIERGTLLDRYSVESLLKRSLGHGISGAVFALKDTPRSAFTQL